MKMTRKQFIGLTGQPNEAYNQMNMVVYAWSKVKYRRSNPHISYSSSSELTKAIQFGKMQFEDRNEKHYTPMRWPI